MEVGWFPLHCGVVRRGLGEGEPPDCAAQDGSGGLISRDDVNTTPHGAHFAHAIFFPRLAQERFATQSVSTLKPLFIVLVCHVSLAVIVV